jgi:hypothetical protein
MDKRARRKPKRNALQTVKVFTGCPPDRLNKNISQFYHMNKKFLSAAFAACIANPFGSMPIVAVGSAIVSFPSSPAHAGTFPGMNKIIQDLMPCDAIRASNRQPSSCIILRERVNLFQGLGKTKSAQQYCQEKYGTDTSVVWKIGLRWCATPVPYGA